MSPLGAPVGEGSERGQCCCLASGVFPSNKLSPSTHPVASHSNFSPDDTGALSAVALVLNPRGGESTYVLNLCGPFKRSVLKIPQFLLHPNPPLQFLQPEIMESYLPGSRILGWVVWSGVRIPHPRGILPGFYLPHGDMGPPVPPVLLHTILHLHDSLHLSTSLHVSVSLPLLPAWINVASLNLWLLVFHTALFSDNSG